MSSAGHILDMIARLKANRDQRNRTTYGGNKSTKEGFRKGKLVFPNTFTPEERAAFHKKLALGRRHRKWKNLIIFFVSFLITSFLVYLIFWQL